MNFFTIITGRFQTPSNVDKNRRLYLNMSTHEKRKLYKCAKFVTQQELIPWPQLFLKNKLKHFEFEDKRKINETLNSKICLFEGDITSLEIDAIVSTTNNQFFGDCGLDKFIQSRAGDLLLEECKTLNGCATGSAKITAGYHLPAKYVIHTVGPKEEKFDLLKNCYKSCLDLARKNNCRTIAFPLISAGIKQYPIEKSARIVLDEIRKYLEVHHDSFDMIIFCMFTVESKVFYIRYLCRYFPVAESDQDVKEDQNVRLYIE